MIAALGRVLHPLLNTTYVRHVRRNHGLEHATIHMLNRQRYQLSGRSSANGFVLFGDVPTERIESALQEALRRMKRGEHQWAVHPHCGTNLLTTGALMTTVAMLGFANVSLRKGWQRFPMVMMLMMAASFISQPLGMALQKHITTDGDLGDLEVLGVTRQEMTLPLIGRTVLHFVATHQS